MNRSYTMCLSCSVLCIIILFMFSINFSYKSHKYYPYFLLYMIADSLTPSSSSQLLPAVVVRLSQLVSEEEDIDHEKPGELDNDNVKRVSQL